MNKAVFLDRDGVINIDHGYTSKPEEFEFYDGVFDACLRYQKSGYKLVVVTNQSGIGRGYYSEQQFHVLSQWMVAEFAKRGITINGVYFCPHHPQKAQTEYLQDCECRKPRPGMLLQAKEELELDMAQSVMVGDKESDVLAGIAAGVGRCFRISDKTVSTAANATVTALSEVRID